MTRGLPEAGRQVPEWESRKRCDTLTPHTYHGASVLYRLLPSYTVFYLLLSSCLSAALPYTLPNALFGLGLASMLVACYTRLSVRARAFLCLYSLLPLYLDVFCTKRLVSHLRLVRSISIRLPRKLWRSCSLPLVTLHVRYVASAQSRICTIEQGLGL